MGPIIWYLEPRCAFMGKKLASVFVVDVSKADVLKHQLIDLQHSLADLAILSARQEQLQQTCLKELHSLQNQPTTPS
ncbi:hypothetical protein ACFX15_037245 [Malus domestica]